jgi:DNA-binding beta-propeller fold protein YncE
MTTPDVNFDRTTDQTLPAEPTADLEGAGPAADGAPVADDAAAAEDEAGRRKRRRKLILFSILAALVSLMALFGGWYLLTRKPIPEILPGITEDALPKYSYAIYGVQKPIGIAVSPSGDRIYVAETEGQRTVHIFDGKGNPAGTFAPPKSLPGSRTPVYIAIDPTNGDVYVSDRVARAVYIYDASGAYRRAFTPKSAMPDWQPLGLAFDQQGNLYVGDVSAPFHRIHEFRSDGTLIRTIGQAGQFNFPNGLAVDAKGNLLVVDGNNGRLLQIDGTGRQVGALAHGVGAGELALPRGVAVDDQGRLYVVDATGQGVDVYRFNDTKIPKFIGLLGTEGAGDGQFEFPFGVATDARGRIYIADWANNRVQIWSY